MQHLAYFKFYGTLNDFLSPLKKETWITYGFTNAPAVKDAIEAIGVPHPEVQEIRVNGWVAGFYYPLQPGDHVAVFDYSKERVNNLLPAPAVANAFVLDVHLGKLARALRLLGIDSAYQNNFSDQDIARIAQTEGRVVLTRDIGLLKHKVIQKGYWLRSQQLEAQLAEVIQRFDLGPLFQPFSRCIACNGAIEPVAKQSVLKKLPPDTIKYFHQFYQCPNCGRVYWKGSHFDKMQRLVERFTALGK